MEKFTSLVQAVQKAAQSCNNWLFANSKESHDLASLSIIASVHDEENPLDEGDFYLVAPNGSIGQLSSDLTIEWLFLPPGVWASSMPASFAATASFCPQCGRPVHAAANFCSGCGNRLN